MDATRSASATEYSFTGAYSSSWNYNGNWNPVGIPGTGDTADIFLGGLVSYGISNTNAPDLSAVQIAGGVPGSPAELSLSNSSGLEISRGLYLGGTVTGTAGSASGTGPGEILQNFGNVSMDAGSVLMVDPSSSYFLGLSGTLIGSTESLAGIFTQSGSSSNQLGIGMVLTNSGTYTLQGSAVLASDTINNSSTFIQAGSTSLRGTSGTGNTSFTNSGAFNYTGGTFAGFMTNNAAATVTITGANIPFSLGILDNGSMTVTNGTGSYAGAISGSGSMLFNGSQGITLTGSDSLNGTTNIAGGTLTLASTAGAALQGTITVATNGTLAFGASSQFGAVAQMNITGGTVVLAAYNESITALNLSPGRFNLSGTGYLGSGNEQLAGTFNQSGAGCNVLMSGAVLTNSATYLLSGTGLLEADTIVNGSVFNQSGASLRGSTTTSANFNNSGMYYFSGGNFSGNVTNTVGATYNFAGGASAGTVNNSGTFFYSGGTSSGYITNNPGATMTITNGSAGATIPFAQGILQNGQMTVTGINGTYPGSISGSGNILFNGSQLVTLTGSGSFNGSTSITSGTLTLSAPVGPVLAGTITVGSAGTLAFGADGQLGAGTILTVNSGNVNLAGHTESVASLIMSGGSIVQPSGAGLGVTSGQVIDTKSASISGGLRSDSTLAFNVAKNQMLTVSGNLAAVASNASTGLILNGSGGTLSISGNSLLSSIDIQQGLLQLTEGGYFGGFAPSTTVEALGSMNLNGQTTTIGDLSGSGTVALGSGSLTVNSSSSGSTFSGTINGTGSLTKFGAGTLTLTGTDSASGATTVDVGTLTVAPNASIGASTITAGAFTTVNLNGSITNNPALNVNGTVNIGPNNGSAIQTVAVGQVNIGVNSGPGNGQLNTTLASTHSNRILLVATGLSFPGSTNSWSGQLNLANNDMVVNNGDISAITNQVKTGFNLAAGGNFSGNGIVSSAAAADATHLTTLGVIQNNNGQSLPIYGAGAPTSSFDGYNASVSDVLIKYTYFGDANLDGKIDGSDYSLIDNGFLGNLTGWYNGDFNYDGVVNGSDYTLIDNAFNTQGTSLAAVVAEPTAQLAGTTAAVPEPAFVGLMSLGSLAMLKRRGSRGRIRPA